MRVTRRVKRYDFLDAGRHPVVWSIQNAHELARFGWIVR